MDETVKKFAKVIHVMSKTILLGEVETLLEEFKEKIIKESVPLGCVVIASEQPKGDLANGAVADFVNKCGLDCPYCGDNSGQIIHGYSGDSLADLEMCEFCYTTPNSKFNLRNDLEELLKKATASL
jgi:hypothetical protein